MLSEGVARDIYCRLTEVRTCGESFLKVSVVYSLYKLLSHVDGLWSVFLPLSAHKLMNEIADESQRLARNPFRDTKRQVRRHHGIRSTKRFRRRKKTGKKLRF